MEGIYIKIRQDERGLWTADLCTPKHDTIKNLGGSYPKVNSVILDAKQTWGNQLQVVLVG